VLECSPGLEVVEVASPALHETLADHEMRLPTGRLAPDREFGGQLFLFHRAARRGWTADLETGFQQRRTGIGGATGGIADARVLRSAGADSLAAASNRSELLFGFVLEGSAVLQCRGDHRLSASDAFVIPAAETWALRNCSADLALLEVTAPQPSASAVAAGES
jgi:mannose-6-phosphate isomerase-like protein (cupin superfamily)